MKFVFADTLYWVAITRPNDPWAEPARAAREKLGKVVLVTTDEVLSEFLAALSKSGPAIRGLGVQVVREILNDPDVQVVPQSREGFLQALDRFSKREDKSYSLTDCISMNVMESLGMREVLTNDHHFAQEGFAPLIQQPSS